MCTGVCVLTNHVCSELSTFIHSNDYTKVHLMPVRKVTYSGCLAELAVSTFSTLVIELPTLVTVLPTLEVIEYKV